MTDLVAAVKSTRPANDKVRVGEYRPGCVPRPVRLALTDGKLAAFVPTRSAPMTPPGVFGVKVTGTVSLSPGFSVTGNDAAAPLTFAEPALNGAAAETALTVTWLAAVNVAVALPGFPTRTWPKLSGAPLSGAASGLPNPNRLPSLVPT
jgi:hypothetical protein